MFMTGVISMNDVLRFNFSGLCMVEVDVIVEY